MNNIKKLFLVTGCMLMQQASTAQHLDIDILKGINKTETGFKDKYLDFNTSLVYPLSIAVPVSMAVAGLIKHDQALKQDALYLGASVIASTAVTTATKHLVNRKRPFAVYPFIVNRTDSETYLSFPSGHTSASFCTAASLALRYRKWYVIVPGCVYAFSVGWGRMYQGVHYPSDVLAGALVGTASAWLGYKAQKWITRKKEQKKNITL